MDTNTSDYINDATLQSIIDQSTTADGLINSTQFVQLVNSQQSGTNSRHPLDFPACWAKQIDSSGNWMLVFGGFMIFYCFLLTSKRELIWRILLIHGVCGMIAALLDTAFSALRECGNIPKNTALIWGLIIAQHSLGWVWHETAVVAYSFLKTETIVSNTISKRCMRGLMMFLFAGFLVCHALIVKSRINNENFSQIQAYAYIISGTAELVILALLIVNTVHHIRNSKSSSTMSVLSTLLKSSIPRILIVVTTTIGIVSLNTQFKQRSRASRILWLIKDSFPIILLIDCILTKTLLLRIFVDQQGYLTGSYNNDESNNANGKAAVAAAVAKDGAVSSAWTTSTTHDDKEERVVSSSFGSTFNERQSEVVEVDSYYFK